MTTLLGLAEVIKPLITIRDFMKPVQNIYWPVPPADIIDNAEGRSEPVSVEPALETRWPNFLATGLGKRLIWFMIALGGATGSVLRYAVGRLAITYLGPSTVYWTLFL